MDILEQIRNASNFENLKKIVSDNFEKSIANLTNRGFQIDKATGILPSKTGFPKPLINDLAQEIEKMNEIFIFNAWHFLYWGIENDIWNYSKYDPKDMKYFENLKQEVDTKK